ncbi:hypothetical protein ACFV84_07265 [Kitasatospora sp. NPDC059811]|uniref:hypothetical protein n=1 Tax=Streptomycetaceae TaxID=2062 RepID=UPI001FCB85FB|nr:hypothetical protein [Streptomyces sp. MJM8645]
MCGAGGLGEIGQQSADHPALADGGEAIADLALLLDQPDVFGPVPSAPTTR